MASQTRDPQEIERDIENERSELSRSMREIQSRFTPEAFLREAARFARDNGSDFGQSVAASIKRNPLAVGLTGVGLAWLIFGRSDGDRRDGSDGGGVAADQPDLFDRTRTPPRQFNTPRLDAGRYRDGKGDDASSPEMSRRTSRTYPEWLVPKSGQSDTVSDPSEHPKKSSQSVSDTARDVSGTVSDAAKSAGDNIAQTASDASERLAQVRDRIYHGTEELNEAAKERVAAARQAAIDAQQFAMQAARRGWRTGRATAEDFFEEQPLVAGALAMAVGAAIAGALPRTRSEDEWFGAESDWLIDEAERIFEEERAKVEGVAKAAANEALKVVREKADEADAAATSAVKTVAEEARDATDRVRTAAQDESQRTNLSGAKD